MKKILFPFLIILSISISACSGGGGGNGNKENSEAGDASETSQASTSGSVRSCGASEAALKIMPLGDSVTESERGHNSYRRALWFNLIQAGCVVDFVGSRTGVSTGTRDSAQVPALNPDFDQDHEGHWDYKANEILQFIDIWIGRYLPDIVLLHIGTNDIFRGDGAANALADIEALIDVMRAIKPDIIILLAKVIPSTRAQGGLNQLNAQIDSLAAAKNTARSRILVVDHASGYSTSDNYDGIHPGPSGERKMADKWTNAILRVVAES